MDNIIDINTLRAEEAACWRDEAKRRKALQASDEATIQAYLNGEGAAAQTDTDEIEVQQDPKGRAKPRRSGKKRTVYYRTEGSAAKIANPAKVADEAISEYCSEEPEDPEDLEEIYDDSEDSERKSADPNKKKKKGKDREWQWGPDFRMRKRSKKADKACARQIAAERREARAKKGKENAEKSARKKAEQAKIAAAREEAITSHEPAKYTGVAAVDATARTRGKRTAGRRIPGKSRKSC